MEIRPVDLPALRDETVDFFVRDGEFINGELIRQGGLSTGLAFPTRSQSQLVRDVTATEVAHLKTSELFHVSRQMAEVALAAAASLPVFDLMPEDVVTPAGLMFFEKPLPCFADVAGYAEQGRPPVVAVGWGKVPGATRPGLWVSWYTSRNETLEGYVRAGVYTRKEIESATIDYGRILPTRRAFLMFSADRTDSVETAAFGDLGPALLKTIWLLMAQPLASVEDAKYDRAARRRIERQGKEPPRVRVITLRRPASSGIGESDREWHHQWIVRGHWRQHWHPARKVHRPTWIAPHVKGPEGAPMLGGEKVYALRR